MIDVVALAIVPKGEIEVRIGKVFQGHEWCSNSLKLGLALFKMFNVQKYFQAMINCRYSLAEEFTSLLAL